MMLPEWFNIESAACATGHRPNKLGGYYPDNPTAKLVKSALAEMVLTAINNGFLSFISGGAQGVDQWFANIVLDYKKEIKEIKLIMAIPFSEQDKIWPEKAKQHWRWLCNQADYVHIVCDEGYANWKMQRRNEWMVDHSSLVFAIWDGSAGGTHNCIKYARKQKKPILHFNPFNPQAGIGIKLLD